MNGRPQFALALASVILAVMLWLHVKSEAALNITTKVHFPLRAVGLNEEQYIVRSIPPDVMVEVEGTDEEQDRFTKLFVAQKTPAPKTGATADRTSTLVASVDLSDARPESSAYRVRLPNNEAVVQTGVKLRLVNEEVPIIIEQVASKDMEVTRDDYNTPPGLALQSAEIKPEKVTMRGPMGDLGRVDQVRARVDLTQAVVRGMTVTLEAIDAKGMIVDTVRLIPSEVTVYPQFSKVPPEKDVLVSAQIAAGKLAPGFRLTGYDVVPNKVRVRGEINLLASLKSLLTDPVPIDGLNASRSVRVRLRIPRGLAVDSKWNTVEVRLQIEPIPEVATPPVKPPVTNGAGTTGTTGTNP